MTHIHRSALLSYSDAKMFALVNDVSAYPDYLDGCIKADVLEQTPTLMRATLGLESKGVQLNFTTENVLDAPKSIVMSLIDGPFDAFEGRWFFQHLDDDACKVILDMQFELSNRLTSFAAKKLFDAVSNNMVDAMVVRAKKLYG